MRQVSADRLREAIRKKKKRPAPSGLPQMRAIAKQPCPSAPSPAEDPSDVTRPLAPRVEDPAPTTDAQGGGVEENDATLAAPADSRRDGLRRPTGAPTSSGIVRPPLPPSGAGSSSRGASQSEIRWAPKVVGSRCGDEYTRKASFWVDATALHDSHTARELSKIVLLPRDVEERRGVRIEDTVAGLFPTLVGLLHDASAIRRTLNQLTELRHSQSAQLAETEAKLEGCDRLLDKAREQEERLRAEMADLKEAVEAGAREREALTARTNLRMTEARARQTDLELRLAQTEEARRTAEERARSAEEKARVAEDSLAAAVVRAMEEYKDSEAFEVDAAEAGTEAYSIGFGDCKARVLQLFPELDLGGVTADGGASDGEEQAGEARPMEELAAEDPLQGVDAGEGGATEVAAGSPPPVIVVDS